MFQTSNYALFLQLCSLSVLVLIFYIRKQYHGTGSIAAIICLAGNFLWFESYALEITFTQIRWQLFWNQLQYPATVLILSSLLIFTIQSTGKKNLISPRNIILLNFIPILCIIIVYTNQYHGWFWPSHFQREAAGLILIDHSHGPAYYVFSIYYQLLMMIALIFLGRSVSQTKDIYRKQSATLLLTIGLPEALSLLIASGWDPFPPINPMALVIISAASIFSWGLFRFQLGDLVPIARSQIMEELDYPIIVLDAGYRILDINPAGTQILGIDGNAIGQNIDIFPPISNLFLGIIRKHKDRVAHDNDQVIKLDVSGITRMFEVWVSVIRNIQNDATGWTITLRDITQQKTIELELHHSAHFDALTNLPNRYYFLKNIEAYFQRGPVDDPEKLAALLYVDLDGFKQINDQFGHSVGDATLIEVGKRISEQIRSEDFASRIGGDEFIILVSNWPCSKDIRQLGERILDAIRQPIPVGNEIVQISASIGITPIGNNYSSIEFLMRDVDAAMYRAKEFGKGRIYFQEKVSPLER